jgi:hypothetical protein
MLQRISPYFSFGSVMNSAPRLFHNPQHAADLIRVCGDAERYRRLVRGGPAPDVDNQPSIRDLNVPRRTLAVASAQNAAAEDLFIK